MVHPNPVFFKIFVIELTENTGLLIKRILIKGGDNWQVFLTSEKYPNRIKKNMEPNIKKLNLTRMNVQVLWVAPTKGMQFNSNTTYCHTLRQSLSYAPGIPIFKKFLQVQNQQRCQQIKEIKYIQGTNMYNKGKELGCR